MLKIRLQRVGRKHEPAFRLVLTDSQNSTKSGRFKEVLGSYDPRKDTDTIDAERVKYWLDQGTQTTDTVHNLLLKHGVIEGKKRNVLPKKTVPVKEDSPQEENNQETSNEEQTSTNEEASSVTNEAGTEEVKVEETPVEEPKVEETPAETPTE